jgi:hypothetical protein
MEGDASSFGFLGALIGLDKFERRIFDRLASIEHLIASTTADAEALQAALTVLKSADATVDAIEPEPTQGVPQ